MPKPSPYTEYGLRLNHWTVAEAACWVCGTTPAIHGLAVNPGVPTILDQLLSDALEAIVSGEFHSIKLKRERFVRPWDFGEWVVERWIPKREADKTKGRKRRTAKKEESTRIWVDDPATPEEALRERCQSLYVWQAPDFEFLRNKPAWTKKESASLILGKVIIDDPLDCANVQARGVGVEYGDTVSNDTARKLEVQKPFLAFFESAIRIELHPIESDGPNHFRASDIRNWIGRHGIRPAFDLDVSPSGTRKSQKKRSGKRRGRPRRYDPKVENTIAKEWKHCNRVGGAKYQDFLDNWPLDITRPEYLNSPNDLSRLVKRYDERQRRKD